MREPPISFDDPRYLRKADTPEAAGLWRLIWQQEEALLAAIGAGKGALGALVTEDVLKICPRPNRAFRTMAGAQVAAFARFHGYKPAKTQSLYGSLWSKVACFVPVEKSAAVEEATQLKALQARVAHLEKLVQRLCGQSGLEAGSLGVAAP